MTTVKMFLEKYLPRKSYCGVCLGTPDKVRLVICEDPKYFDFIKVSSVKMLCIWCNSKIKSFVSLLEMAHRSEKLLADIALGGDLQSLQLKFIEDFQDLGKVKFSSSSPTITECVPNGEAKKGEEKEAVKIEEVIDDDENGCEFDAWETTETIEVAENSCFIKEEKISSDVIEVEVKAVNVARKNKYKEDLSKPPKRPLSLRKKRLCMKKNPITKNSRLSQLITDINSGKREIKLCKKDKIFKILGNIINDNIICSRYTPDEQRQVHERTLRDGRYQKREYKCERCAVGFVSRRVFEEHLEKHVQTPQNKYECDVCSTYHPSPDALGSHVDGHYRFYQCARCGARWARLENAASHYFSRHGDFVFECDQCGFTHKNPVFTKKHFIEKHGRKPVSHTKECHICHKIFTTFATDTYYRKHVRSHTTPLSFHCEICNKEFTGVQRTNHMQLHKDQVKCEMCGKIFRPHGLKKHMERVHCDLKKFQCDVCGKLFKLKADIKMHLWSHFKTDGVACRVCDKVFRTQSLVAQHARSVHDKLTVPKNHLCDICGKAFANKTLLTAHRSTHTGVKPHKCELCGQCFSYRASLSKHMENHDKQPRRRRKDVALFG